MRARIPALNIVFFGTPDFAMPSLRALLDSRHIVSLVVAQPDRPSGRGMKMQSPPTIVEAKGRAIECLQPEKVRDPAFLERVRQSRSDLGIVIAYGRILPSTLLIIPTHGFLNVHASLLPAYRGAAPIQRALEAGERETGVTIMRVDEQLDHGPILGTARLSIGDQERMPELSARLARQGAASLLDVIDAVEQGTSRETEQDHAQATHAAKLERSEGLIDWSAAAGSIYNRFRGFDPWPGVFFKAGSEMVKVVGMRPSEESGTPGEIVSLGGRTAIVAAGDRSLELVQVKRPGKPSVDAAEYFRSRDRRTGDRLE
ncbi:MAG TPA: methionyl-tRNA formyltransferase [Thermoanaerobaculia bacterium]|nr:methionyl-tRNA formyltransferase [Thermoanaerobaculia bacterium]